MSDHEFSMESLADRVVITPAERGVLVEQAESMKVALDVFIEHGKKGTGGDVLRSYIEVVRNHEYINGIINHKVMVTLAKDHEEGREH